MIGAHYNSDKYNIDFVVHDQVLLACAQSHLSSLDNEPIKYIRDERGTIKGVVSVYWDFVLSGIKGNSPGIKIVDKYWYTCEDTLLPEDKQVWINTGIKASFEFSDLTEDEIKILQQPGIDAAHGAVQAVIVQETGSNTDKIMSQDAVTKELNKKATKVELTEAIANEVARAENTYQPKGDYATNHRVDVLQQEVNDFKDSSNAEFTNVKTLITEEQERATAAESDLNTKIDTEISNRETTDTHLANLLKAEVIRATTEESKLNSKIDAEIANREATDTALTNALNSEITRATNKETELLNAINTEIADRKSAVQTEIDRATAAESALQSSLDAEIARAKSAEQTNAANIAKEVTDRTNAVSAEQTARINADNALDSRVTSIESKIPIQASSTNQLADKAFVNSSIATSTAVFKGTFTNLDTLKATPADDNDYAFYSHVDSSGNTKYDKYKYTASGWVFEYTLNNSSFTSEQWAAINSGATASIINTVPKSVEVVGTGNAVTAASLSSGKLTLSKNSTFLTSHQPLKTLTIQKNGTQVGTFNPATDGTINITDVASASTLNSHINNATVHVTEAEKTKWNNASTSIGSLTVTTTGSGNVISSITNNGSTITATKGITALTSHQSISHLLKIDGSNGTKEGVDELLRKLTISNNNVLDTTYVITSTNSGDASGLEYYRRPVTSFWDYIKEKADTIYQPKGSYLTSHQTIYNLTIQGNGTTIGTFDPNGANKTINITPASIGLGNVRNQAFYESPVHINGNTWSLAVAVAKDGFNIYAPVTAGTSGQILKSTGGVPTWVDASGFIGSTAWADITSKPTTLAGYGITDAKIENGTITLGGNSITPLTSGSFVTTNTSQTITADKSFNAAINMTTNNAILFPDSTTKKVLTRGCAIHGGGDKTAEADANLRFGSWYGVGWYNTCIKGQSSSFAQGDNAMWLNVRTGHLFVQGGYHVKGGTSSQFLKANGSVDSNSYLTTGTASSTYVKKSGDTMTGRLSINTYGNTLSFGSKNSDWCHYETDATQGHWFNKNVSVKGEIYAGLEYDQKVWHSGNDGSGSGLDADMLDGWHLCKGTSFTPWGMVVGIGTNGVIEVGRYMDWHYDNTTGSDYSCRLQVQGNNSNVVNLPTGPGTLARTVDNVASATKWATARTITLTGSVTGSVSIDGSANVTLATTTNHTHTSSQVSGLATVATSGSYNDLTNKPSIPSAYTLPTASASTLGGVKIGSNINISNGVISVDENLGSIPTVTCSSTETTKALNCDNFYVWADAMSSLTITLNSYTEDGLYHEYMFQFTSPSGSGTTLSLPSSITWIGGSAPTIKASKTYQVSIVNNLAVIGEF